MAMTQFAYGKLENYKIKGEKLPIPGGFDKDGNVTNDPEKILDTMQGLPIGYWKGAGLSLLLDLLVSNISSGDSTSDLSNRDDEYGVSQIFLAFNLKKLSNADDVQTHLKKTIDYYKASLPAKDSVILYPGERVLKTRAKNLKDGIPVPESIWESIQKM